MSLDKQMSSRNRAIADMLKNGDSLKNFYRFTAQNPHLSLHDACQIVIERPQATICFSMEEWNAMDRRVTKGSKGIGYFDTKGRRRYLFDVSDTHGTDRYKRLVLPIKRLLVGIDALNGTENYQSQRSDYNKIFAGIAKYLYRNSYFTDDETKNKLIAEGVAYSLYCKTGFPKSSGIQLKGLPYSLKENAQLYKDIYSLTEQVEEEINDAYLNKIAEVKVIEDIEEEAISDEPIAKPTYVKDNAKIEETINDNTIASLENIKSTSTSITKEVEELEHISPIYKEYIEYEKQFPTEIVAMRVGDFYEIMNEKAVNAAEVLELVLTSRNVGLEERIPMCGFPYHVADKYFEKLLDKYNVVVVENGEQPKYIKAHTQFAISDTEQVEEIAQASEQQDFEEYEEEQEEIQPQVKSSKPISKRKRKPIQQPTIFDYLEEQQPDARQLLIERALQGGSGFEDGKVRIYDEYLTDPSIEDFACFLKEEYGTGGYYNGEFDLQYSGKGLRAGLIDKQSPQNNIVVDLKWAEVATHIADLIDDNKYFNQEEWEEYQQRVQARKQRASASTDEEKIKVIAKQMIEINLAKVKRKPIVSINASKFDESYQFITEHLEQIKQELLEHKEVVDVYINGTSYIDINFDKQFCPNFIAEDTVKGEKQATAPNTNLNDINFNQSELGGAKARYKNNVEAIKLLHNLEFQKRNATTEEKPILAKYVGWGGLAQAFDEHNTSWQNEYKELKTILTQEEYDRAKGSVLNAHYTSKEVIEGIFSGLKRLGVNGSNRILEPSMGTGNFFGYMPQDIANNAKLYGVELDNLTGRIAQQLYPDAKIQVRGFEETTFPNDHFDIVIGNVPFGNYTVFDSDYNKHNFLIHDYFIAKSIDKVRQGGIVAVITSKGTMDKLNPSSRKYIADRAELLGAIRLPNNAFKQTANTEAVTDILFFQKREQIINANVDNCEWLKTSKSPEGYEINAYYVNHPEQILGTLVEERGLYGAVDVTVKADNRELGQAIQQAIECLPQNIYENIVRTESQQQTVDVDYDVKQMCLTAIDYKIYMRMGEEMVEQALPKTPKDAYDRIVNMIALRKEIHKILEMQKNGCSDEQLKNEQFVLNSQYDSFVKKYGYLNSSTNSRLFKDDGDSALVFACEELSEDKKTATKADIFTKRTIRPYVAVTNTDDCYEALQISRNEKGVVDISYIEQLTGKDYDTIIKELSNKIYRNPVKVKFEDKYSGFETAEEYLSGEVVKKLRIAKQYVSTGKSEFAKNVEALESVQPTPLTASEISVRLAASWVDQEYYKQFLIELLKVPYYYRDGVEIFYNKHDSSWRVERSNYVRNSVNMNATEVYGTNRANAFRLFEDALNMRSTTIYDTVEEGGKEKRVLNQAETIAAREKQAKIKEAFKDWIFNDPERREQLEEKYNSLFNQIRLPSYDGSHLQFPDMNPAIELRPHQKDAVERIITGDNTLLHHVVGAGKTYTICAAIMKLRQFGLAKKPMVAVPNHLVQQWATDFRKLFPNAKLLIASKEDLDKDNRQRFVSRVALGDWDAVIIAQSSFAKINISQERQVNKIKQEIEAIQASIESQWDNMGSRSSIKNLERIKKSREAQLKKLLSDSKKDNVLNFESLGVDYLFVDEAHYYKNLFLYTKMNNVAGISMSASQRASDLQLKCEYINELHGGDKGVVFATGTPISNSMTEMYTMQTYLQNSKLKELGIAFFDGWAADFGETITSLELAPSGQGYKAKTRFAKFTNLPELLSLYRSFADVKTADMVKLDVPEVERNIVTLKPTDLVVELAESIASRAERISKGNVDPHEDNMLKVTSDGKKLALDARCYDNMVDDESSSKLNACVERVFDIWQSTQENKSTQIIFCDLSTPKKAFEDYEYGKDFDVYNDIKYKLVEKGIPKEEIAYIHEANTDDQKQALFNNVNDGKIRVLIGSTEKCGAGTNVQERLYALHHLDTPYRPSDMQQREGRIIRQGNTNDKVKIFTYVTERTFDSYSYQILENKQRFISQIDRGDLTVREADDIDETTLSYAEIKAITSANPKIKRKMELDNEVARLRVLEGQYKKNLYTLQDKVRKYFPDEIKKQNLYIDRLMEDKAMIAKLYDSENFSISVNGITYTDRKEGGVALTDALYGSKTDTVVAEYCGFGISLNPILMITEEQSITLRGSGNYRIEIGQSHSGNLTRLENFVKDFDNKEQRARQKLEQLEKDFEIAKQQLDVPFEHKDRLIELNTELNELNEELNLNKREEIVIDEGESTSEVAEHETSRTVKDRVQRRVRKPLEKYSMQTYQQQKEQTPEAYIFVRNGGYYELLGEKAKEYADSKNMDIDIDYINDQKTYVLSLDSVALDRVVKELVDSGKIVKIIEKLYEEKGVEFLLNEEQLEKLEVPLLPDYTVTQEYMHDYGYKWDGILPIRKSVAKRLMDKGVQVYKLNTDDTFVKMESQEDIDKEKGLFGVEKLMWNYHLGQESTKAMYLARKAISDSAMKFVKNELSYVSDNYVINILEELSKENEALDKYLKNVEIDNEEVKPYLKEQLEQITNVASAFPMEEYGWDKLNVEDEIIDNIANVEFKEHLRKEKQLELDKVIDEIMSEMSLDELVDMMDLPPIDYKKEVKEKVNAEMQRYKESILNLPSEEIFEKAYEINVYNELSEVLVNQEELDDVHYKALYQDGDNILSSMYEEFLHNEYASVATYDDTIDFIVQYNQKYHSDILDEGEKQTVKEEENLVEQPTEKPKTKWITANVSSDAVIRRYEQHTFFRMPENSQYKGYTYNIFNNRIKDSSQIADNQDDSRELSYLLSLKEDEYITISNIYGDTEYLQANDFVQIVNGTLAKDYEKVYENENTIAYKFTLPREAMRGMYENASLFSMPYDSEYRGYSYYLPNAFLTEATESEGEEIEIRLPADLKVTLKNKKGDVKVLSAYDYCKFCENIKAEDYKLVREQVEDTTQNTEQESWSYVLVDNNARIAKYENRTLLKMPNGKYSGYSYYIPNNLITENEQEEKLKIALPKDFVVTLKNGSLQQTLQLNIDEFIENVDGKISEDYLMDYHKPSEGKHSAFEDIESRLDTNIPEEMKARSNWVIVRTRENKETGRLEKYLISPVTGKFAESDNPATWTDYETAKQYAKQNGGVTLAYALDGKDNICCIDVDKCVDESGKVAPLVDILKNYTNGTYMEKSVSGKGYHFWGKTKGMDVRAFSKNGELEFYQKSHFIAVTGDVETKGELKNIDDTPASRLIQELCEKRTQWKGASLGVEGLSSMSDREVVEKASESKNGDIFKALYNGQNLQNNHSNSDMSLMNRLAFWCNGDKEQMLRIFATSGLYRPEKSPDYYECTAVKAIRDTSTRYQPQIAKPTKITPRTSDNQKG